MAKKITLNLPHDVGVLQQRLAPFVGAHQPWLRSHRGPLYYGSFSHMGFKLRRRISYKNSFAPAARATFRPNVEGTTVDLSVAAPGILIAAVVVNLVLAITSVLGFSFVALVITSSEDNASPFVWLIPVGAFAFPLLVIALFYSGYRKEAGMAEQELTAILKGQVGPASSALQK